MKFGLTKQMLEMLRKEMGKNEIRTNGTSMVIRKAGESYPYFDENETREIFSKALKEKIDFDSIIILTDKNEFNLVLPQRIHIIKYMRIIDNLNSAYTLVDFVIKSGITKQKKVNYWISNYINIVNTLLDAELRQQIEEQNYLKDMKEFLLMANNYFKKNNMNMCQKYLQITQNIAQIRLIKHAGTGKQILDEKKEV